MGGAGDAAKPVLKIGPGSLWFEREGGVRVPLGNRPTIHRLFAHLVKMRRERPGVASGALQPFEVGWPESAPPAPDVATNRVYSAIWWMRDNGLGDVLERESDGYLIDPEAPLVFESGG